MDGEASEENGGVEEGIGFGDGYDFGAGSEAGLCEGLFRGIPDETYTVSAVAADFYEIFRGEICIAAEDGMAGVGVIVDWRSVLWRSTPVTDGQFGIGAAQERMPPNRRTPENPLESTIELALSVGKPTVLLNFPLTASLPLLILMFALSLTTWAARPRGVAVDIDA